MADEAQRVFVSNAITGVVKRRLSSMLRHLRPSSSAADYSGIPKADPAKFRAALRAHTASFALKDAVDEHGTICKMSDSLVCLVDPDAIRELTKIQDKKSKLLHTKSFVPHAWYDLPCMTMVATNGEDWSVRRQSTKHLFTLAKVRKTQTQLMDQNLVRFCTLLDSAAASGQVLDMQDEFCRYFFQFSGQFLFGYDVGCAGPHESRRQDGNRLFELISKGPYWCDMLLERNAETNDANTTLGQEFLRDREDLLRLVHQILQTRREELELVGFDSEESFVSVMMQQISPHTRERFTNQELQMDVIDMFVAGFDTSGHTAAHFMQLINAHRSTREKLVEEVRRELGESGPTVGVVVPRFEQLQRMVHLDATLKETMRIRPPTPDATTRVLVRDTELGGYTLPKGTKVWANIYAGHNTRRHYDEPTAFRPSRWLKDGATTCPVATFRDCLSNFKEGSGRAGPWFPFGAGARACLGYQVATFHLKKMLSALLLRYTFVCPPGVSDEVSDEELHSYIMMSFREGLPRRVAMA
jgi:cytochrome P450